MITKWLRPASFLLCSFLALADVCAALAEVKVSVLRPKHPVLIRNDHSPLLQLIVDVPGEKEVRLKAAHFSFDGCDDVSDLDSAALFVTGDKDAFSPTTLFGW